MSNIDLQTVSTEDLVSEIVRRNGMVDADHMRRGFVVPTPLGLLHAYPAYDPDYPGVYVDITPAGDNFEYPVILVEATDTEADLERGPHLITRIWQDIKENDYSERVVHKNVKEKQNEKI